MGPTDLFLEPIRDKLADLDRQFERELASPIPLIARINAHIARHSGKRIRPTLLLLCARLLGYRGNGDVTLSAVIEFIHTATLLHDDIIDDAKVRRGSPSVNALWGNDVTVLLGDYLYLKSMELALTRDSLAALRILTEVTIAMIEGELMQLARKGDLALGRDDYLEVIRRKTAALFSGCGRLAALLAGADADRTAAVTRYCLHAGMTFQLVDDLLDFVGDERALGKPVLSDLREGRITLPVIDLLERAGGPERELVRRIVSGGETAPQDRERLLAALRRHGSIEALMSLAHEHAKEARTQLARFPDSDARRVLEALPGWLVARTS